MKKQTYKLTGILYLLVIICAGFSQGYVRETIIISGDALATSNNILQNEGLFRLGFTLDLIAFIIDAAISVLLYQMFKPFGKNLAMISAALRLLAHPAIGSMNLINHFLALQVLSGPELLAAFDQNQLEALSLFFVNAHQYGYLIAGGFFGMHCFLLGISIYKSDTVPNIFGGLLLGSAAGYLIETFGNYNLPGHESLTALIVGVVAALGEVSLTLYFIFKGKRA